MVRQWRYPPPTATSQTHQLTCKRDGARWYGSLKMKNRRLRREGGRLWNDCGLKRVWPFDAQRGLIDGDAAATCTPRARLVLPQAD